MVLKQNIQEHLRQALKKQRREEVLYLRSFLASVLNKEKEKRYRISKEKPGAEQEKLDKESRLNDEEIIKLLFSEVKKRKEAIRDFKRGKRQDLVEKEQGEIKILERYLPKLFSEDEIRERAVKIIKQENAEGIKDMGKVIGKLMAKSKGRADGAMASRVVKELLWE